MATDATAGRRARGALATLCAAQFLLVLDVAIVNVALAPLAEDLATDTGRLQLVASVYAATFGGLLLLAGRVADRADRRRVFVGGLTVFGAASVVCAVTPTIEVLLVGRALQGAGAAFAAPAALALLTTSHPQGPERARALGTWAAVGAAGGAAGLVVGGIVTTTLGWRAVFAVTAVVVVTVVLASLRTLPSSAGRRRDRGVTAAGLLAAGGVVLLVAGLAAAEAGSQAPLVTALLGSAVVVGAATWAVDRSSPDPLVPVAVRASRVVLTANAVTALMSAAVLGTNFFLALHLQQRLSLSAVATGAAFLPMTALSAVTARVAAAARGEPARRRFLVLGMVAVAAGCALLARMPTDGGYVTAVLPGLLLVSAGMGPGFAVGSIAATSGVEPHHQGAAAALLSTSTQAGAAVGLAALSFVAAASGASGGPRAAYLAMAAAGLAATLPVRADQATPSAAPHALPAPAAGCLPGCVAATVSSRPWSAP